MQRPSPKISRVLFRDCNVLCVWVDFEDHSGIPGVLRRKHLTGLTWLCTQDANPAVGFH